MHELGSKEGVATRLPSDRVRHSPRCRVVAAQELQRQIAGLSRRQWVNQDSSSRDALSVFRRQKGPEKRASFHVLGPETSHQQQYRRLGRPQQGFQQLSAIHVPPLQVVNG